MYIYIYIYTYIYVYIHIHTYREIVVGERLLVLLRRISLRQEELKQLHALLRATSIFGLLFLAFGPPYAWLLLRMLFGAKWAETEVRLDSFVFSMRSRILFFVFFFFALRVAAAADALWSQVGRDRGETIYIYIHIYIYIYIYICMYICIYTYIRTYIYICLCINVMVD